MCSYTTVEVIQKAKEDFSNGDPPVIDTDDSGIRKIYFDTYYTLRTNSRLKHVFDKYPHLKLYL
jgi:hypothetical protein